MHFVCVMPLYVNGNLHVQPFLVATTGSSAGSAAGRYALTKFCSSSNLAGASKYVDASNTAGGMQLYTIKLSGMQMVKNVLPAAMAEAHALAELFLDPARHKTRHSVLRRIRIATKLFPLRKKRLRHPLLMNGHLSHLECMVPVNAADVENLMTTTLQVSARPPFTAVTTRSAC